VIVAYIDAYRARFGVEPICAVLTEHGVTIAPSTYHAHKVTPVSVAALEEAYLVNALYTLWADNWGVYGVRKLHHAARRAGLAVGRDQVGRLMAIAGIRGVTRGRHTTGTTVRDETAPRHPDLVKRGWDTPTCPDQLWVADFSYVWTLTGFVYVAFIVDVFSRRILGWRVSTSKHTPLVTDALQQALATRRCCIDRLNLPSTRRWRSPPNSSTTACTDRSAPSVMPWSKWSRSGLPRSSHGRVECRTRKGCGIRRVGQPA